MALGSELAAFTVTLPSGTQTRSADSKVRYDQIIYNPQNEYSPTTGIFTVGNGLAGVYWMSVSMMSGLVPAHTTIMKNGEILVWLFTNNSYDMATQSITVELSAGDKIWVQIANSGSSLFSVYNTFSAFKIMSTEGFSP
ncbi:collagen alpha-1(X) chain-like [Mytilus trossulus]|uniref:collagen alpha-1(X) chain-like n=1 Tax=Mytilus trossulus TaxID=6551 RepID=UPI0030054586